jgi:DNA mismatch repair ATPase MutL
MGMSPSVFEETGPNVDVETEQKMQRGVKDTIVNFFGGGTTAGSSSSNRNNSKSVDSNSNSERRTPSGEGKSTAALSNNNSTKPVGSNKSDKPPLPAYMKFSPPPPQRRPVSSNNSNNNHNNSNHNNGKMTSTAGKHSRSSSSSSSNPPHPHPPNPNLEISIPPPPTGVDLLAHPESNERTDSSMTTRARKYSLGKGDSPMAKDPNAEARVHRSPPANREKQIVAADNGHWTCTTCTLINPKESEMCEACGVWRSS